MAIANKNYHIQIKEYLQSNPTVDAEGNDISMETPLLGTLTGSAPAPGEQDERDYSGLAKGGIYHYVPRPWDPDENRWVNPIAFKASSGSIKPLVVVKLLSIPTHFQADPALKAITPSVECWMYAPSHENGLNSMELMRQKLDQLLDGLIFQTQQGPWAQVQFGFNFGVQDNHREFPGSVVDFTRYDLVTLRKV